MMQSQNQAIQRQRYWEGLEAAIFANYEPALSAKGEAAVSGAGEAAICGPLESEERLVGLQR